LRQSTYRLASHHMATCKQSTFCLISTLIQYRLLRFRRVTAEGLSKLAVQDFHPIQNREAITLALALIKSPPTIRMCVSKQACAQQDVAAQSLRELEGQD
jgi:hypothetical protein